MNRNKMIWGGLGVIVVAVVAVAIFSPFPPKDDLSGAVGVAKQYRADQITDADVVLQDPEIQDLLQSDFFYKLATDAEFRKVAVDQLARLDLASGRTAQFTNPASIADMENFLAIVVDNPELKTALSEGRMDIVRKVLTAEGKIHYFDIANRICVTQGKNPEINARSYVDMKVALELARTNVEMRRALADGRVEIAQRVLATEGKTELNDAMGRVFLAVAISNPVSRDYTLSNMRAFLEMTKTNVEMREALTTGRMDIVHKILVREGRTNLGDVANRVFITVARGPEIKAEALDDMRSFIDLTAANPNLRNAFADGKMEVVNKVLVTDGKTDLQEAARLVYFADGRGAQIKSAVSFADMKALLEMAKTNVEMRNALADGRMDIVRKILVAENRHDLFNASYRVYTALGRNREVNFIALADMRNVVEFAEGRTDLQAALADGRLDIAQKALVAEGKAELNDAMGRVFLAVAVNSPVSRDYTVRSMRAALDLAKTNVEMRNALAEGRLDIAQKVLATEGKTYLDDAVGRLFIGLGRSPELNAQALEDMRSFLDAAGADANLRAAVTDGRVDIAEKVLVSSGRTELQDAMGRVFLAVPIASPVSRDYTIGSMKAVASFAAESGEFRQAVQEGRIEMAARVARAAGRMDISLRNLQVTSFVVGDSRVFINDLDRLVAIADTPAFRQAAESPGWGRMLATTDGGTWKMTVEAVSEGKFNNIQN